KIEKIEHVDGSEYAIVEMDAIPSAGGERETYQEHAASALPPMTDIRLDYTGQMNFNVTEGTLTKYQENLKNEWLIVPPVPGQSGPPFSISMTALQTYNIEEID
ncbi:MAG: hypothetical protein P8016_01385, partial [Sedimentisphaerales bacterium]